jgi:colanic acid/amylovoran biosynthesis glycosyltransferase
VKNASGTAHPRTRDVACSLRIGYLVNQYPKISHTFIRTEIAALEALGVEIERFSIRHTAERLIDSEDLAEERRTRILLEPGVDGIKSLLQACMRPILLGRALALAVRMGFKSERGVARHLMYLAEACVLRRWAINADVQHIHAHFGTNPTAVALLCHSLGGPAFSFTVHGPEEFDKPGPISLEKKIQYAAFVVGVSDFGRAQLWRYTAASQWEKIRVVRCSVDSRFIRNEAAEIPDAPRLVCVGRLCEQKGQLLLIRAASVLNERGIECDLVLVGDGEMRSLLETEISKHGLAERVRITGWQTPEQVTGHIENSRAMVLPSFAEGLPIVIMEALALHRPVISTYVAGIPELVIPGETGWLVPAGAVSPLVDAMQDVLQCDRDRLARMGQAGNKRVLALHDAGKSARQLKQLISEGAIK